MWTIIPPRPSLALAPALGTHHKFTIHSQASRSLYSLPTVRLFILLAALCAARSQARFTRQTFNRMAKVIVPSGALALSLLFLLAAGGAIRPTEARMAHSHRRFDRGGRFRAFACHAERESWTPDVSQACPPIPRDALSISLVQT